MTTFVTRPAAETDLPFILDSWLKNYRDETLKTSEGRLIPGDLWWSAVGHKGVVQRAVTSGMVDVTVAHVDGVPDEICGWLAHTGALLHYVFVKKDYRGAGVARLLLAEMPPGPLRVTHLTRAAHRWSGGRIEYDPFSLHNLGGQA